MGAPAAIDTSPDVAYRPQLVVPDHVVRPADPHPLRVRRPDAPRSLPGGMTMREHGAWVISPAVAGAATGWLIRTFGANLLLLGSVMLIVMVIVELLYDHGPRTLRRRRRRIR